MGKVSNRLAARMGAEAFWPTELADGELDKAARILRTFTIDGAHADEGPHAEASGGVDAQHHANPTTQHTRQKVLRKIPPKALQQACGVAIFTCFRTGFGWSGAGGSGVVLARKPDGSWSAPSGILIHTIGWGAVIGLDVYDVVLVIRKPETLQAFTRPKVSVGGELSVAAGPVGNGAVVEAGADGKPVWSYVKSKGLYVGLQLDGTIVLKVRVGASGASLLDLTSPHRHRTASETMQTLDCMVARFPWQTSLQDPSRLLRLLSLFCRRCTLQRVGHRCWARMRSHRARRRVILLYLKKSCSRIRQVRNRGKTTTRGLPGHRRLLMLQLRSLAAGISTPNTKPQKALRSVRLHALSMVKVQAMRTRSAPLAATPLHLRTTKPPQDMGLYPTHLLSSRETQRLKRRHCVRGMHRRLLSVVAAAQQPAHRRALARGSRHCTTSQAQKRATCRLLWAKPSRSLVRKGISGTVVD